MTSDRVRSAVILVVLAVWVTVVAATLVKGQLPDAPLLGIPGAIWLALYPPRIGRGGEDSTPPAAVADQSPPANPAPGGGGTTT